MDKTQLSSNRLSEKDIKAAVLQFLESRKALDDGVVINEFPVANWSRRADLAIANGKLSAIEIKSDLDSLRRLDGQISSFLMRFDKVILVTTTKFLSAAKERLPSQVEIWEANSDDGSVMLRVARRGRSVEIKSPAILSAYLSKPELVMFLKANSVPAVVGESRDDLEAFVSKLPVLRLRRFVLARLKLKYAGMQSAPLAPRARLVGFTQRSAPSSADIVVSSMSRRPTLNVCRSARLATFEAKFGNLPENAPREVRPRRSRSLI